MKGKKLLIATLFTSVAAVAVGAFALAPKLESGRIRATSDAYVCGDIVFSETVNNPGKNADITKLSDYATTTLTGTMTDWTNANYGDKGATAIKIGGSKSGKYSGQFTLTLTGTYVIDKVIAYATGWAGDTGDIILDINGVSNTVSKTASGGTYSYTGYTFQLPSRTKTLTIKNDESASGKSRVVISKLVFRLYEE